jgi:hypothetical protein
VVSSSRARSTADGVAFNSNNKKGGNDTWIKEKKKTHDQRKGKTKERQKDITVMQPFGK